MYLVGIRIPYDLDDPDEDEFLDRLENRLDDAVGGEYLVRFDRKAGTALYAAPAEHRDILVATFPNHQHVDPAADPDDPDYWDYDYRHPY